MAPAALLRSPSLVTARSGRLCALAHTRLLLVRPTGWAYARRYLHNNVLTSLPPGLFDKLTALTVLYVMRWRPLRCYAPCRF